MSENLCLSLSDAIVAVVFLMAFGASIYFAVVAAYEIKRFQ